MRSNLRDPRLDAASDSPFAREAFEAEKRADDRVGKQASGLSLSTPWVTAFAGESAPQPQFDIGVIGDDDRKRITPTIAVPWRWMCHVEIKDTKDRVEPGGSGLLVSDRHVLTAAHVVWAACQDPQLHSVTVRPGYDYDKEPFGSIVASKIRVCPKYDPTKSDADEWDYALITLHSAIGGETFDSIDHQALGFWGDGRDGDAFVFGPGDPGFLQKTTALTAGYPGDKGYGRELWCASGALRSIGTRRTPYLMWTTADMTPGQSGSPMWVENGNQRMVVGVGVLASTANNAVRRITPEMLKEVRGWIAKDGEKAMLPEPTGNAQPAASSHEAPSRPASEGEESETIDPEISGVAVASYTTEDQVSEEEALEIPAQASASPAFSHCPDDAGLRLPLSLPPECKKRLETMRVAVVGCGLAGLMAARRLGEHGVKNVTLFEARSQVGGRVLSSTELSSGRIIEQGAELIGLFHTTWLALARHYGIKLITRTSEKEYKRMGLLPRMRLDKELCMNELEAVDEEMEKRVLHPIAEVAQSTNFDPCKPWDDPGALLKHDIPVAQFLREQLQIDPRKDERLWKRLELYLVNDEVSSLEEMSFLGLLCKVKGGQGRQFTLDPGAKPEEVRNPNGYWDDLETFRCADGCQALASKMADELRSQFKFSVRTGICVAELKMSTEKINLGIKPVVAGKPSPGKAIPFNDLDYVIMTIPPSVWDGVKVYVNGTETDLKSKIGGMSMGPAVKYFAEVNGPFWITKKAAPTGGGWEFGQVWEGTDNQMHVGNQGTILSVFAGPAVQDSHDRRAPTKSECESGLKSLYKENVSDFKRGWYADWPNTPFIRTGYAAPKKGEIFLAGKNLNHPFYERLFFAGEHTQMDTFGYMEGALRSGERSAEDLILRACGLKRDPVTNVAETTELRLLPDGPAELEESAGNAEEEQLAFQLDSPGPVILKAVGERVELDLAASPYASSYEKVKWTIPGRFVQGYDGTARDAKLFELQGSDLERPKITFFWVDAGAGRTVRAKITTKDGTEHEWEIVFDVEGPTVDVFTTEVGETQIAERSGLREMRFGKPLKAPGVRWCWKVTMPAKHAGRIKDVQTALSDRSRVETSGADAKDTRKMVWRHPKKRNLHVQLDGSDSGQAVYSAGLLESSIEAGKSFANGTRGNEDSPGTELPGVAKTVSVNEQFNYYLMFKPETEKPFNAIWVPMAKAKWSWKSVATQSGSKWSVRPEKMKPAIEKSTLEFPMYETNLAENEWLDEAELKSSP